MRYRHSALLYDMQARVNHVKLIVNLENSDTDWNTDSINVPT